MGFSTVRLAIGGRIRDRRHVEAGSKGRVIGPSTSDASDKDERVLVEFEDGTKCNVLAKTEIETPEQGHLRFMSSEYQPTEDGMCPELLWNVNVCEQRCSSMRWCLEWIGRKMGICSGSHRRLSRHHAAVWWCMVLMRVWLQAGLEEPWKPWKACKSLVCGSLTASGLESE